MSEIDLEKVKKNHFLVDLNYQGDQGCKCGRSSNCIILQLADEVEKLRKEAADDRVEMGHLQTAAAHVPELKEENDRLTEALEFYEGLTVSRDEDVTAIDGGKTAMKLDALYRAVKYYSNKLEYQPFGPEGTLPILEDRGKIARTALEKNV